MMAEHTCFGLSTVVLVLETSVCCITLKLIL